MGEISEPVEFNEQYGVYQVVADSLVELENIGIRDYLDGQFICFIEWPQKGDGLLPAADIIVDLEYAGDRRRLGVTVRTGRAFDLEITQ